MDPVTAALDGIAFGMRLDKKRNVIERCVNKPRQFRHIATRHDRNPLNYRAAVKIASTRLWLRHCESAT
jgi:transposase